MTDLLSAARGGDREAFSTLVQPHRRELLVHCYRMLGSYEDAEDALQEALLAAWVGIAGFAGSSSLRTWLYRIATHRCLNAVRSASRRPQSAAVLLGQAPEPTSNGEVVWLQPIAELALAGLPDAAPGPEARYEMREAVSLAFIRALQLLPSQQRAVLLLREVLGYTAAEAAELLEVSVDSANGALKRARARLREDRVEAKAAAVDDSDERRLLAVFVERFTAGDVAGLVELFDDDVWVRMPPLALEYRGPAAAAAFLEVMRPHTMSLSSMIPVWCNGQQGWGEYVWDSTTGTERLTGVLVPDVKGRAITALTHFESHVGVTLGLPRTIHR